MKDRKQDLEKEMSIAAGVIATAQVLAAQCPARNTRRAKQ